MSQTKRLDRVIRRIADGVGVLLLLVALLFALRAL
jgi:hypothetical protein